MERRFLLVLAVLAVFSCVSSRWLPTRSQDDRLDKLREMLKDLLEAEMDKAYNERRAVFKREIGPSLETRDKNNMQVNQAEPALALSTPTHPLPQLNN